MQFVIHQAKNKFRKMEPLFSENTPTTLFTSAKNKKKNKKID